MNPVKSLLKCKYLGFILLCTHLYTNQTFIYFIVLTCTEVIDPFLVVVILSCMVPISVARVG